MRNNPTIITTTLNGHVMMDRVEWYPEWPEVPNPDDPIGFERIVLNGAFEGSDDLLNGHFTTEDGQFHASGLEGGLR